ncbi:hypothetical protein MIND_01104800 [Mycena indigotica]|uniref:Uncharacterized protein n=1 Tax=Mycena indigotica TaxID=2126181 RepID=A0A8H6SBE6_9AGAR|nr:uncharacterized protein MIND_01104800 [Mycena indigotica]KAF7295646.1 hypothetical protein MIND_01104800 [Mycena indigotica]
MPIGFKAPTLPKAPSLPSVPKIPSLPTPKFTLPSTPTLPSLPSTDSITNAVIDARAKVVRSMSTLVSPSEEESQELEEAKEEPPLEPVYIVLRPLKLTEAPSAYLKRLGKIVKAIEFENYLALQHWGVLIGERYYHLHIDDATKNISVSMVPFVAEHERHTIKFPIWRTRLTHEQRVGVAVGIIKSMGRFKTEDEVEITDEKGALVTAPADRERYHMKGRYLSSPLAEHNIFRGKYNALANNCIHFTRHYIFDQILTRRKEMNNFASNVKWLVVKWRDMGCRRGPLELAKFLSGILGMANPLAMTPDKGAKIMIKLLSIFLDIDYNPVLDKKLLDDTKSVEEVLDEDPEPSVDDMQKDPAHLPIPEVVDGEEKV